ncbi:MAG: glycosyltransferase family 4 protein [Rhodospirillales bacterium]|nr:glycosyltransferase family 4 protein [Rhodospirillales bacterium]
MAQHDRFPTILQVLPALGAQGGVERGCVDVAAAIVRAGGRAIVASAGGPLTPVLEASGARHERLPLESKNPAAMAANAWRLAALVRRHGVDVVHARSRAPAWSAWVAARRSGCPFVTTFHGTYGAGNPMKRRYNSIMTRGRPVIAISRFIAAHIQSVYGLSERHIRIIHRGADIGAFAPERVSPERVAALAARWGLRDGAPLVLLPGRLSRWKGQAVLIEAMARVGRRDVRTVILGDHQGRVDYHRELQDLIVRHGLGEQVLIIGHCDDMPAAYRLADVVVSASIEPEAFGRVAVEAQALGRPVIATDHGGARETVIEGETGWLTPPGDAAALAAALERALALGGHERARMAETAIAHVRANFTNDVMCRKTLAIYREAAGGRRA